ncbi:MAG: DUF72 domain-containing protein [Actinomycetota bacterium]
MAAGASDGGAADRPVLRIGCAMWALRDWVGRYFPPDTPPGRELRAYGTWCTAAEGNTTFYGLPEPATVERWAEDAPRDFRFLFKLPRTVTHDRRLRSADAEVSAFLDRLSPLGRRAAPHSIQLPASFGPDDLPVLDRFLAGLSGEYDWAVEVRHPDFADGGQTERRLNDLLAQRGVDRIIIDTRAVFAGPRKTPAEQEAHERKPRLPVRPVAIGRHPVVRFIGQTAAEANPGWWSKWVPKVAQWLDEGRRPLVFVHTPDNLVAPELARRFHGEVAALRPDLAPLPEPGRPASQLKLL